jgi:formylglycine-generating enzyme required for sulfatase activity
MGNVYEWTSDELGDGRAVRGGSWDSLPDKARASNRERYEPRGRNVYLGVRCAR